MKSYLEGRGGKDVVAVTVGTNLSNVATVSGKKQGTQAYIGVMIANVSKTRGLSCFQQRAIC